MQYDKLVRDNIPDIIRAKGGQPITHVAESEEYRQKLDEKLQEEVAEFLASHETEELADILEVIHVLLALKGQTPAELEEIRQRKANERGGFDQRIVLEQA